MKFSSSFFKTSFLTSFGFFSVSMLAQAQVSAQVIMQCSFQLNDQAEIQSTTFNNSGQSLGCKVFCYQKAGLAGVSSPDGLEAAKCLWGAQGSSGQRLDLSRYAVTAPQVQNAAGAGSNNTTVSGSGDAPSNPSIAAPSSFVQKKQKRLENLNEQLKVRQTQRTTVLAKVTAQNTQRLARVADPTGVKVQKTLKASEKQGERLSVMNSAIDKQREAQALANSNKISALQANKQNASAADIAKIDEKIAKIAKQETAQEAAADKKKNVIENKIVKVAQKAVSDVEKLEAKKVVASTKAQAKADLKVAKAEAKVATLDKRSADLAQKSAAESESYTQKIAALEVSKADASADQVAKIQKEIDKLNVKKTKQAAVATKQQEKLAADKSATLAAVDPVNSAEAKRVRTVEATNAKRLEKIEDALDKNIEKTQSMIDTVQGQIDAVTKVGPTP